MEHVYSSRNEEDGHEAEPYNPFFLGFPSPFFDDITLPNHTHQQHPNITEPLPTELKSQKKTSVGKKDRHSKIHTAQGLRDRRMRLSLHIARKFFELQDLLGFDKASKTIEWLFCKSNEAIKEVAETFNSKHPNQSTSEGVEMMESLLSECQVGLTNKVKHTKNKEEEIKNREPKKRIQRHFLGRETRVQARARARERTRSRLMSKELEKSKNMFGGNHKDKDEIYKLGLGYLESLDNHNIGYTSSPSEPTQQESSSSPSLEHSSTHHLLRELQSANYNNLYSSGSLITHNPPADWLNSSNGFLGISGGWDSDNFINDLCEYGIVPNTAPLTGDHIYEQNPNSFSMSTTTNFEFQHFQSQNQTN